jgi:hypothetical protein
MDSGSSDEEDAIPTTSAFDVLMQPPCKKAKVDEEQPNVIAVVYIRLLKWIDPSEPLHGCPYIGQAVRALLTANEVAAMRWKEENRNAIRENKRVGLLHELNVHGPEAFDDQIVEWKQGQRSEVQRWANELEAALITEHGGPLRDPSVRCKQTLNLTGGGKRGCSFDAMDASRTVAWLQFQDEYQDYIECHGTALVPASHVNPVSGYKLGQRLTGVRQGELWKGHPDEADRVKWLESLPGWAWNVKKTDEWREGVSERTKDRWANADDETRAGWSKKISDASKKMWNDEEKRFELCEKILKGAKAARDNADEETRAEWSRKISDAVTAAWANADEEKRTMWRRHISEAKSTPEFKAIASERGKAMWANADEDTLAKWSRQISEAKSTPESKAACSERAKAQMKREAAEGKKSLNERSRESRLKQQAAKMASLTSDKKREQYQRQIDSNIRKGVRKKRELDALRQVPGWEDAKQRDIPKARLAGVLPSIN